jgi:hypothetical protein
MLQQLMKSSASELQWQLDTSFPRCLIASWYFQAYEKSCSVGDSRRQSIECINSLGAIDEAHIQFLFNCFQ